MISNSEIVEIVIQLANTGRDEETCVNYLGYLLSIDFRTANSQAKQFDDLTYIVYDYPLAEEWLREQDDHSCKITVLGDTGYFWLVEFTDKPNSMHFKLRWVE